MKSLKKHENKQLEKFSTIFMQIGFVFTLFVVFVSLEYETVKKTAVLQPTEPEVYETVFTFQQPIVKREVKAVVKNKKKTVKEVYKPEIVDNSTDLTIVENVIDNTPNPDFDLSKVKEVTEIETIDTTDDPISIHNVQSTPVFKGCENLSEEENKKCFERKIQKHIQRHFNSEIGQDVGLRSGKYKILTQFIIDKSGNVVDIKIRAPHHKLQSETNRVVTKIPKFTPGKQNDRAVKVRYTLPITFRVD